MFSPSEGLNLQHPINLTQKREQRKDWNNLPHNSEQGQSKTEPQEEEKQFVLYVSEAWTVMNQSNIKFMPHLKGAGTAVVYIWFIFWNRI